MTTVFGAEVIRIAADGSTTTHYLTIQDDDLNLEDNEAGTSWAIDGQALAAAPLIRFTDADLTLTGGNAFTSGGISFTVDGATYFLHGSLTADRIETITNLVPGSVVGAITYTSVQAPPQDSGSLTSQALVINAFGGVTTTGIETVQLFDDDGQINLSDEIGGSPVALLGDSSRAVEMLPLAPEQMDLVEVSYQDQGGTAATFQALRYTLGSRVYYIPATGSVDLADVATVLSVTALPDSADGQNWSAYGFDLNRVERLGSPVSDVLEGDYINDRLLGLQGDDNLFGGVGQDELRGGNGADRAFGGIQDDLLFGDRGNDRLFGSVGHDSLNGGRGNDLLNGGSGDDTLTGGEGTDVLQGKDGSDVLQGGAGRDVLQDGTGSDRLEGGSGADTFVFVQDFTTDQITDFTDGLDLIETTFRFRDMIISDVAPGTVHILMGDDLLILQDRAGQLTAADITRADFVL